MSNKSSKKFITDKRAANLKLFSVGSVIILFAIVLVVNILLYLTLDKALSFDMSSNSQNSISKQTKEFIDNIPSDKKVRIVGLFDEPTGSLEDTNLEYIVPMLNSMDVYAGNKITVEYINPNNNPTIINELDPDQLTDIRSNRMGQYAVCCEGKIRFVHPLNDCFTLQYDSDGYPYPTSNKAESAFVNSIFYVTTESTEKAYFLTDIQGSSHEVIDSILMSMNVVCEDLSVNTQDFKIPSDCNMLFILNPNVDISEKVQEAIKEYIWNGDQPCNIIVSISFGAENSAEKYPHLNNVLNEVNLAIEDRCIWENDPSYILDTDSGTSKARLVDTYAENNSSGYIISRYARNIVSYGAQVSGIVTKPIAQSSEAVSLVHLNEFDENGDPLYEQAGSSNLAMVAYSEGMVRQINVFVFGSEYFTDDKVLTYFGSNSENMQFLRTLLSHVSISEDQYIIPAKDINSFAIDQARVNQNSVSAISIIFLVGIPMVFIFIAWVVYYRRSRL